MAPCTLEPGSVSLLVQEHLLPGSQEDGAWVEEWSSDCQLQQGVTLRIPYDPDEIASFQVGADLPEAVAVAGDGSIKSDTELVPTEEEFSRKVDAESVVAESAVPENQVSTPLLPDTTLEDPMPEDSPAPEEDDKTEALEVVPDPSSNELTQGFNDLAQTTGADPTLTIILALVAVLGGGAAWKFYRQHSEQKHEQRMQEMKMEAKAKGMEGQSPGPCQTVHAQLKAEVEEMKSRLDKVDKKMALNADFDSDDLERKVRKLERWRRSVEEDEEDDA